MPEPDDDLDALRAADPVDMASVPSASSPEARRLYERITMTESIPNPASPRRRNLLAAAAAAVVVIAGGVTFAATQGDDGSPSQSASPTSAPDPGGSSLTSCVESYDLDTLRRREVAFDGTVASVDGDNVTFSVNRWYKGGSAPQVTLAGASTLFGQTSAGPSMPAGPGSRFLVAGDGGFAWSCGFTQPYDAAVASEWEAALR